MRRKFDKIQFINGILALWENGSGRPYTCPFALPNRCGKWCIHCGDVKPVEPIVNGSVVLERADGIKYELNLTCGCGVTLEAKEFENTTIRDFEVSQ